MSALWRAAAVCAALAGAASAQEAIERVNQAPEGAVLRWLDKVAGTAHDLVLAPGETGIEGRLAITLRECRYPVDDPAGDAFARLTIREDGAEAPAFDGWMIASSPALSALDHRRYDVWVLRCRISSGEGTAP